MARKTIAALSEERLQMLAALPIVSPPCSRNSDGSSSSISTATAAAAALSRSSSTSRGWTSSQAPSPADSPRSLQLSELTTIVGQAGWQLDAATASGLDFDAICPLLQAPPPPGLESELPSRGSALHKLGLCKPCGFHWKQQGCRNGASCNHCHLCEAKRRRRGRNGETEEECPSWIADLLDEPDEEAELEAMQILPAVPQPALPVGLQIRAPPGLSLPAEKDEEDEEDEEDVGDAIEEPPMPSVPPSVGSTMHHRGECKPCTWYWKKGGCLRGADCLHCHLCSKNERKARRRAELRAQQRA